MELDEQAGFHGLYITHETNTSRLDPNVTCRSTENAEISLSSNFMTVYSQYDRVNIAEIQPHDAEYPTEKHPQKPC